MTGGESRPACLLEQGGREPCFSGGGGEKGGVGAIRRVGGGEAGRDTLHQ